MNEILKDLFQFFRGIPKDLIEIDDLITLQNDALALQQLPHDVGSVKMGFPGEEPVPVHHSVGR